MFPFDVFSFSQSQHFIAIYQSYPVAMLAGSERTDVEKGGKIIMPPSALQRLTTANISYPMMFKLTNAPLNRSTHSGVLEFVADEGRVYLPLWMMNNLLLKEGDPVKIESALLPVATFSRFQPQSTDFLDISNPKAVLENCLRHFACLTTGDVINLKYNDKDYQLSVLETRPNDAVNIIECDMNVDFAPPIGYVEKPKPNAAETQPKSGAQDVSAFQGEGRRLDGKKKTMIENEIPTQTTARARGTPDYDWKVGSLTFSRQFPQNQPCSSFYQHEPLTANTQ